jgi:hypothetical protein
MSVAMIAITTRSSTSVKPTGRRRWRVGPRASFPVDDAAAAVFAGQKGVAETGFSSSAESRSMIGIEELHTKVSILRIGINSSSVSASAVLST